MYSVDKLKFVESLGAILICAKCKQPANYLRLYLQYSHYPEDRIEEEIKKIESTLEMCGTKRCELCKQLLLKKEKKEEDSKVY